MKILGISGLDLRGLEKTGQLSRFMRAYLVAYASQFDRIYVFSPPPDDQTPVPGGRVMVIPPRWSGFPLIYQYLAPFLHPEMRACHVHRVMHMTGSVSSMITWLMWRIPVVATYGYDYRKAVWMSARSRFLLWFKYAYVTLIVHLGLLVAARVIITAPALLDKLARQGKQNRFIVIPNGVDTRSFAPAETVVSASPLLRILFVGRLEPEKNLLHLIDELAMLGDIPYEMTFVGNGSLRRRLADYAGEKRINCRLDGTVPHEELPAVFRSHDVFVLPSLHEGLPKALIEAMSCGLCCIGSDIEGIRTLLKDGETGLVTNFSRGSLAAALRRAWCDTGLRARLGRNARNVVVEKYDLQKLLSLETSILSSVTQ